MFCKELKYKVEKMEKRINELNNTIDELLTLLDIQKEDYIEETRNYYYPFLGDSFMKKVIKERLVKKSKKNK